MSNGQFLPKATKGSDYYSSLQSLLSGAGKTPQFEIGALQGSFSAPEEPKKVKPFKTLVGEHAYEIINSKVKFGDVIQTPSLKRALNELINEYSNKHVLTRYGIHGDNKIIFYGPSGCGKTLSALALANKLNKKLFLVNLSTIVDSGLGKTSNNVFQVVEDAMNERGIIFFDEFDAMAKLRSDQNDHGEMKRVASAIIQIMDFLDEHTILIAATNHLDLIDKAILRRFSKKISFDLPTKVQLQAYIKKILVPTKLSISQPVVVKLAEEFTGLSYAEARDHFLGKLKQYLISQSKKTKSQLKVVSNEILKY